MVKIGILGASGYTGAELLRLLGDHPQAEIVALTAERQAGRPIGGVFPQLAVYDLPTLVKIDDVDIGGLDVLFCCLPHATTQAIVKALPRGSCRLPQFQAEPSRQKMPPASCSQPAG